MNQSDHEYWYLLPTISCTHILITQGPYSIIFTHSLESNVTQTSWFHRICSSEKNNYLILYIVHNGMWLTKSSLLFKRRKPPFPFVNISVFCCWIFSFQIKSLLWTGTCLYVFFLSNAMLKLGKFMFQITDLTFVVHLYGRLIAFDFESF